MIYTTFNLLLAIGLCLANITPTLLFIPYALQWVETIWGTLRPAVGYKPAAIGIRQLVVSTLFTILFIITWKIG